MNKSTVTAILLGIMAAVGFGLYFSANAAKSKSEAALSGQQARMQQLESDNQRLSAEIAALRKTESDAALKAQMADEAMRQAESKLAADEAARKALLEELNARLQKESAERQAAVDQARLLEARVAELTLALEEAQKLAASSGTPAPVTVMDDGKLALMQNEIELLRKGIVGRDAKIFELEQALLMQNKERSLKSPDLRPSSYKRRDAQYLQSR